MLELSPADPGKHSLAALELLLRKVILSSSYLLLESSLTPDTFEAAERCAHEYSLHLSTR